MKLRYLKIFMTVYETLNFTKAGEKLFIAQPAISLAIKELEDFYGVKLFDRLRRQIHPTTYGHRLYQYTTRLFYLLEEMDDTMRNKENTNTLRIGSSITVGNYLLPKLIASFKTHYPNIKIQVQIINSSTIEKCILQNEIDFALMESSPLAKDIIQIPFMQDHLCTIAHPNHPLAKQKNISLERIAQEDFLLREKGSSLRKVIEGTFLSQGLHIQPLWESTSTYALVEAVQQNLGITTLSYQMIKNRYSPEQLVLLDVPDLNITRNYHIVYYQNKYINHVMADFISFCKQKGCPGC